MSKIFEMKHRIAFLVLTIPLSAMAQSPVGAVSSDRANEVATNTQKPTVEYANAAQEGPRIIVAPGDIKSSNASFAKKVTANAIADFGEVELSRANFKITKNQSNAKFVVKFDIIKAESLAKTAEGFSGGAIGNMLGGVGGRVIKSAKSNDSSEVWNVSMRWQAIEPSGDMAGTGIVEDRMELGAKGSSVMGVSSKASGGATLDTMMHYLIQKAVAEMDARLK